MLVCKHKETSEHLTSGYPILEKNAYLMRHDKVCAHLHHSICKALGIKMTEKWYTHKHTPNSVFEHEDESAMESRNIQRHRSYRKQARYNK